MHQKIILFITFLILSNLMISQKASDILENGIRVKSDQRLFLQYDDTIIKYYIAEGLEKPTYFRDLNDSTIFMVDDREIHLFLLPQNPLNISYNQKMKYITDPIDSIAIASISTIIDGIKLTFPKIEAAINNEMISNIMKGGQIDNQSNNLLVKKKTKCETIQKSFKNQANEIQTLFDNDKVSKIDSIYKEMKIMTFFDEGKTKKELQKIKIKIDFIKQKYKIIESEIDTFSKTLDSLENEKCIDFLTKYVYNEIIEAFRLNINERKKQLRSLNNIYNTLHDEQVLASKGADQIPWVIELEPYKWKRRQLSIHDLEIQIINSNKEFSKIGVEKDIKKSKTIIMRKFNRFVPEVSVGIAHTFFKFNTFGTTSDSTGQQFVDAAKENTLRNINVSTMLNFNLYLRNSSLNPLYQLGFGINSNLPTVFTGFGIRSNIAGVKRIAISSGIAMTWIQELDNLNVGDKVSGTDEINEDLKYQFSWPPKAYVGIQYNF